MAFATISAYFYFGSSVIESGNCVTLGVITLVYAASSFLGYFGLGNIPLAQLARVNMVSVISAVMGFIAVSLIGFDLSLILLTVLHMFDAFKGVTAS